MTVDGLCDMQPTGDDEQGDATADVSLVTRLQLRVKELEWERSTLQNEIDSKQKVDTEHLVASDEEPRTEVSDAIKVLTCCCRYLLDDFRISFVCSIDHISMWYNNEHVGQVGGYLALSSC